MPTISTDFLYALLMAMVKHKKQMDKLGFFNGSNALLKVNWATYLNSGVHLTANDVPIIGHPLSGGGTLDTPVPRVPLQQRGLIGKGLAEVLNLPFLEEQQVK